MDRGAWWAAVHGVAKSWAQLERQAHSAYMRPCKSWIAQGLTHETVVMFLLESSPSVSGQTVTVLEISSTQKAPVSS